MLPDRRKVAKVESTLMPTGASWQAPEAEGLIPVVAAPAGPSKSSNG